MNNIINNIINDIMNNIVPKHSEWTLFYCVFWTATLVKCINNLSISFGSKLNGSVDSLANPSLYKKHSNGFIFVTNA